jgi:hypothetical protein
MQPCAVATPARSLLLLLHIRNRIANLEARSSVLLTQPFQRVKSIERAD